MGLKGEIVKKALKRFPNTPDLTIAKKIYKENRELFDSVENARGNVRRLRGHSGKKAEKKLTDKSMIKPKTYNTNPFNLPDSHSDSFEPHIISQSRTLIISDLHIPYHHNDAIELALKYGLEKKVNCILINGDLIDFATISRHEKDFRARNIASEFDATRQFLQSLRKAFPNAKIVYKEGNHCERWEKYLYVKAPEIFDCEDFRLEVLLRLGELKIEIVKDKRPVKIGKLTVLHGHEFMGGSGGVNPARATFLKSLSSTIVGHYHKTSSHVETTMGGDVISVESQGCLCGMHPMYMPINKWNLGFSYVELDIKTGEYQLYNKKIIKNKVY